MDIVDNGSDFESKIRALISKVAWSIGIDIGDRLTTGARKLKFVINGPLPSEAVFPEGFRDFEVYFQREFILHQKGPYLRKWLRFSGVPSLLANILKDDAKQIAKTWTEGKMDLYSYHQKTGNFYSLQVQLSSMLQLSVRQEQAVAENWKDNYFACFFKEYQNNHLRHPRFLLRSYFPPNLFRIA